MSHICLLSLSPGPHPPESALLDLVLKSQAISLTGAGISKLNFQGSPESLQRNMASFPESEPRACTKRTEEGCWENPSRQISTRKVRRKKSRQCMSKALQSSWCQSHSSSFILLLISLNCVLWPLRRLVVRLSKYYQVAISNITPKKGKPTIYTNFKVPKTKYICFDDAEAAQDFLVSQSEFAIPIIAKHSKPREERELHL